MQSKFEKKWRHRDEGYTHNQWMSVSEIICKQNCFNIIKLTTDCCNLLKLTFTGYYSLQHGVVIFAKLNCVRIKQFSVFLETTARICTKFFRGLGEKFVHYNLLQKRCTGPLKID